MVSGDSLAAWWQRFGDPQMTDLVVQALSSNTSVNNAQAALRRARALRDVAAAALLPTLDASASAQRGTSGGSSTGNRFGVGLDAQWVPDVFGARRAGLEAGDADVAASASNLGDTQVQVAAEVALNYILLRTAQARWAIASQNLGSQQETLQITDWRRQAGLITVLEVEQARSAAAQTRASLPVLQTIIDQTAHALAVLVGQPPAALRAALLIDSTLESGATQASTTHSTPSVAFATAEVLDSGDDPVLSIPAETLRQRADVRAAEYRVAAELARLDQAQAQRWPSFSIGGSINLGAITVAALTSGASVASSLLAGVSLPVFDGGARRARVAAQQAVLEQAQQDYRAAVLTALKDVENALVALNNDRLRLRSLRVAADAAGTAALLARQRYSSGLVDFQVVLETQRTQLSTQDSVISASAAVGNDQVQLFTALGGGWDNTMPLTDSPQTAMP